MRKCVGLLFGAILVLLVVETTHNPQGNAVETQNYKIKARNRIIHDRRHRLIRRKRSSYRTKAGVIHSYNPIISCQGWTYYGPYRCGNCQCVHSSCRKACQNVPKQFPPPYVTQTYPARNPPVVPTTLYPYRDGQIIIENYTDIYKGPGKNWIGPKGGCNCSRGGSHFTTCDITTGQCPCKPHYIGRTCNRCEDGYWESSDGCKKCNCDPDGSRDFNCNQRTGQCPCQPGIGGLICNTCLLNFYGFSAQGCKACEVCNKEGHICDPDTGRCICPPYSHGEHCHHCTMNTWGHEPQKGCKLCNCSSTGSTKMQCNVTTGKCSCRLGYRGLRCEQCDHGYFGYPRCRRCNCNYAGTHPELANCNDRGICQCREDGSCPCKANVDGKRCEQCQDGTFGLDPDNPDGCTQCFCFGRTTKCTEAGLTWGQDRQNSTRILALTKENQKGPLEKLNKLLIIPGEHGNVTLGKQQFETPLYWRLHPIFNGDRVLSYGGYIRFTTETINARRNLRPDVLNHFPLVQLHGNGQLILEYYPLLPIKSKSHEIRLHESLWKCIYPKQTRLTPRELLMIALQRVENILIKATDAAEFDQLILKDVSMDKAIEIRGSPPPVAKGVEVCECPTQYNSSSCQNPSIGFYRYTPKPVNGTIIIDTLVGEARPCQCNGRSNTCNPETGYCTNCTEHTSGNSCERCAEGYYGHPIYGVCQACPCPSVTQNFAKDCHQTVKTNQFICKCKPGYTGAKCDKCNRGYYGAPHKIGGSCLPCDCNPEGRANDECDPETGQCVCRPGVTGKQCSECEQPRHILEKDRCTPCDNCTQWLLNDIDWMAKELYLNTNHLQAGILQPPWETLRSIEKRYVAANIKLSAYLKNKEDAEKLVKDAKLHELEHKIKKIKHKNSKIDVDGIVDRQKELLQNATNFSKEIDDIKSRLQDIIDTLNDFGKSQVSVQEAVTEAKSLMDEIKVISSKIHPPTRDVVERCDEIIGVIEKLTSKKLEDPKKLKSDLSKFTEKLLDLDKHLSKIKSNNQRTRSFNSDHESRIQSLRKKLENIDYESSKFIKEMEKIHYILNNTKDVTRNASKNYDKLQDDAQFADLLQKLMEKEALLNGFNISAFLEPVYRHVLQLENNATEYAKLFNLSSKEADAIKASEAYSNIMKFIIEANDTVQEAKDALEKAQGVIAPEGKDSLYEKTYINEADSDRLKKRVQSQKQRFQALTDQIETLRKRVLITDRDNYNNGRDNGKQDNTIQRLKQKHHEINQRVTAEQLQKVIDDAISMNEKIKEIYRNASDVNIAKQYELAKQFQKYLNLTNKEKLRKLREKIDKTREDLKQIFLLNATSFDIIKERNNQYLEFQTQNNSITRKLEELRAKIQRSKESAEEIPVALSGSSCWRSYRLKHLEPTLITKLSISFNYTMENSTISNSLFYLESSNGQHINLRIDDDMLYFEWNLGQRTNNIKHQLTQGEVYKVDVERIGSHVVLLITPKEKETVRKTSPKPKSDNETEVFNITSSDIVYIGRSPNTTDGIPGCMWDVMFNDRIIGLWNFDKTFDFCTGCIRPKKVAQINGYGFFNGAGFTYFTKERHDLVDPLQFNIQFYLRTFDENAILFLAPDTEKGTFMAITLENGRVKYEVHYQNNEPVILTTKNKYNNGKKVSIAAAKRFKHSEDITLTVNDENLNRSHVISRKELFRVKKVNYYFGGVPPDYMIEYANATKLLHTHNSLLGGLQDVAGNHQSYSLRGDAGYQYQYGIEERSGELQFTKAWFDGEGFVQLKVRNSKVNDLFFLLRTKQSNAFVMSIKNTTIFEIENGKLKTTIIERTKPEVLKSSVDINTDEYCLIELRRGKKRTSLLINGAVQSSIKHSMEQSVDEDDTLIDIGGWPHKKDAVRFQGSISDIIFDYEPIYFNQTSVQNFENVKIGHLQPKITTGAPASIRSFGTSTESGPFNIKEMQSTEGCSKAIKYTLDPNAAKFGDKLFSHVLHYLKELFWTRNYTIEIEFRTFYPYGLLFLSYGPKKHYNLLEIQEGRVAYVIKGKREKVILLSHRIDDGYWHRIVITSNKVKRKRKLQISVDERDVKEAKIPKNKASRELYIGGLPENITLPSVLVSRLHPFRGCIRGLKINDVTQGLVRDKSTNHYNIGQCFPKIEKGSYFGGDAYAIFDKHFRVNKILELNFQFRTSEQNGILLSVSNVGNRPALSIELQDGAVVMSTDMGYGSISKVTNKLSDFALCNNMWHNVTALYSNSELTINVDGIRRSWVQANVDSLMDELEAPLYIGGLPDFASVGTLQVKENFKGCIRNIKIGDHLKDWVDMAEVNNVLLNSCPLV